VEETDQRAARCTDAVHWESTRQDWVIQRPGFVLVLVVGKLALKTDEDEAWNRCGGGGS
jgi:hypothetical protein